VVVKLNLLVVQLTLGLTVLLAGLSLGDAPWAWTNARVVVTLVVGSIGLIAFGIYEWKCE
jgi:hypothetical protein